MTSGSWSKRDWPLTSTSKAGSRRRSSARASRSPVERRALRAGETVPTWLARMPRRPAWNAPPSESRTSASPYQLRSSTKLSGASRSSAHCSPRPEAPGGDGPPGPPRPRGGGARVRGEAPPAGGVFGLREAGAERGRDVGPGAVEVDERDLARGEPRQQASDAAPDQPGADDGE